MNLNKKKIILFSILSLLAIGLAVAYYLYNKGPRDVKNSSGTKITALALYQAYTTDTALARKTYDNKIVEATGIVMQVTQNQQNQALIMLKTNDDGAFINCTMEGPVNTLKEKDAISIKGICIGLQGVEIDMGIKGDVCLTNCYLVKEN